MNILTETIIIMRFTIPAAIFVTVVAARVATNDGLPVCGVEVLKLAYEKVRYVGPLLTTVTSSIHFPS